MIQRAASQPAADDVLAAFRRQPRNAQMALFAGARLEDAGRREEAVAVWSLGDDVEPALRRIKDDPRVDPKLRDYSSRADQAMRAFFTQLHERAIDEFEQQNAGADVRRVREAIWCLTHKEPFSFLTKKQAPVIFYMPSLPAAPVTPNEALDWTGDLEAAFEDIRAEYLAAADEKAKMTPYVPAGTEAREWRKLSGTLDWSAIYLFKGAKSTGQEQSFPKTLAALDKVDLVRVDGAPMEAFFSRLTPGAHIPPHYGLTNTRLTVHLPLIIPDNCAIRVGGVDHHWTEGEIIAFDDSYEHQAWNRSESDRVVLIFEAHHPDLSAHERGAIEHTYAVRQHWLDNRAKLIGLVRR